MILKNTERCRFLYLVRMPWKLEEDEYYMADIIGMDVYTEDGEKFGVLKILWKPVRMMSMWYRQRRTQSCFFRQSMTVFWM